MPSGDFEAFPPLPIVFWEVEWGPQNSNTLALKIHMVLNCKSADSQQTEGQAPVTLVWFGLLKQLSEWQSLKVSGEVQRAMRRIYWKGARKGSFPVTGAFPGKKKKRISNYIQMCPENLPTCFYPLTSQSPSLSIWVLYWESLGFFPCGAIITQNELISLLNKYILKDSFSLFFSLLESGYVHVSEKEQDAPCTWSK